ncbi:MAG: tetratricopeptide repeat protein [Bacteroidota bacterium]
MPRFITLVGVALLFVCPKIKAQTTKVDSLIQVLEHASVDSLKIQAGIRLTRALNQTFPDSALGYALVAAQYARENGDTLLVIQAIENLGRAHLRLGNYAACLELFNEANTLIDQIGDIGIRKAEVLRGMGNIYFIQYQQEVALDYYREALAIVQRLNDPVYIAMLYGSLGNVYMETGPVDSSLHYNLKALAIREELALPNEIVISHLNLGILYEQIDSLDKAIYYSTLAYDFATEHRQDVMATYPLKVLSSVSRKRGAYKEAIEYASRSLELADRLNILYEKKDAHQNLYQTYKAMENYERALHHYEQFDIANDTLLNQDANTKLAEQRTKYEVDQQQQEIVLLEAESRAERNFWLSVTLSLLLLFGSVVAIGIRWIRKRQGALKLLEKDRLILQNQRIITERELENTRLKSEHLQKELTNYALHIVEKNDFLENIKSEFADIRQQAKTPEVVKSINQLGNRIYQNQRITREREEFEMHVEQASEGFLRTLTSKFPSLTQQEKRMAVLLRLDLTSKEIAGILNISPKSVDQNRYRLRKKLALTKETNLNQFLNTI